MKKVFKEFLSLVLVISCLITLVACGGGNQANTGKKAHREITFPLKEEVTFTVMMNGVDDGSIVSQLENNTLWKQLKEKTNVNFEFQFLQAGKETLNLLVADNSYGDLMWGGRLLTSADASKYMASGILTSLSEYVEDKKLMPNIQKLFDELPEAKTSITSADGNIYTLPKSIGFRGTYLESPIWINKGWLDKLGLSIPKTKDEFINVLTAFRDKDPNGNGLQDEIPYLASIGAEDGFMHTEAMLGLFGIATKSGVNDSFCTVQNGKVKFAPVLDGYKDCMKFLNYLYKNRLLYQNCFTGTSRELNTILSQELCVVGCMTSKEPIETSYYDDFVCIPPFKVDGYEAKWYLHPGYLGSSSNFYVTDHCENVDVLMAWMDQFYELETAISTKYGSVGESFVAFEDGKYIIKDFDAVTTSKLNDEKPSLDTIFGSEFIFGILPSAIDEGVLVPGKTEKVFTSNLSIYKDYVTKEIWTRPYYLKEDAYAGDSYKVDIDNQVSIYRGKFIKGEVDIDKTWDSYVESLKKMGLDDYMAIMQRAYNASINVAD